SLAAGANTITATYNGDSSFETSVSSPLTQTVNKAALTVTANSLSKTYGTANPTLTPTVSGVVPGDGITFSDSSTATQFSDVLAGGYAITAPVSDPNNKLANYTVSNSPGTLTITPAALTITADDQNMVYGGTQPILTASFNGLVNGDTPSAVIGLTLSTVPA